MSFLVSGDYREPSGGAGSRYWRWAILAGLGALAIIPYWRAASLPFISDDYLQIWLGRMFGPVAGWKDLAADPLYRCRSTSLVLTYWTERAFGLNPVVYNWSSIILHILNTWLVFCLGVWRPIGWRVSAVAAAFFAIYEGHQEAVVWYAALPELLVFLFCTAAFLTWILWIQRGGGGYVAATLILYVLALLSKESAVVLVPLMLLPVWFEKVSFRRWLGAWGLAALLALVYFGLDFAGKANHLHFHDGTFSLHGPFWITIPRSMFRLFWIWGSLAVVALAAYRMLRARATLIVLGLAWAAISLIPYSFLTYMPFVPSRHTYLPSVGLALVVGAAFVVMAERVKHPIRVSMALALIVAGANCSYIWTRKQRQFAERAAPTEELVEFARKSHRPVLVHCFPYAFETADWAVQLRLGKHIQHLTGPLVHLADADIFCFPAHRLATTSGAFVPLGSAARGSAD